MTEWECRVKGFLLGYCYLDLESFYQGLLQISPPKSLSQVNKRDFLFSTSACLAKTGRKVEEGGGEGGEEYGKPELESGFVMKM